MKKEVNNLYTELVTGLEVAYKQPPLYQVFLYNDDFTPMEFVVHILERFFFMGRQKAVEIMLEAHVSGKAYCGIYSKEVAESKISQVIEYAQTNEHPLICSMEAAI